jgi:hypothetical protein
MSGEKVAFVCVLAAASLSAQPQTAPADDLLPRFQTAVNQMLRRLPDYTCAETIARSVRVDPNAPYRKLDTIRLQVGWIGGQERYGRADAASFDDREVRDLVGRGLTSSGNFAGNVQHVFLSAGTQFTPRGAASLRDRPATRYDYEVPVEYSRYKIRGRPEEAEVGVHGSFWLDSQTLDLLRMEVHADEIPPELGMSRFGEIVDYARQPIGDGEVLLPASSELTVLTLTGDEFRNQTTFNDCRRFQADSKVRFDLDNEVVSTNTQPPAAPSANNEVQPLPPSLLVDLVLDSDIDPEKAAVGDSVRALVTRSIQGATGLLIPEGSVVQGHLTRLDRAGQPFDHFIVGLEFRTLQAGNQRFAFFATMQNAGPARGLLPEARRLDPVFTRRRTARMDILVREKPHGEGILHIEAKHPQVRRGLKMRWRTLDPDKVPSNAP